MFHSRESPFSFYSIVSMFAFWYTGSMKKVLVSRKTMRLVEEIRDEIGRIKRKEEKARLQKKLALVGLGKLVKLRFRLMDSFLIDLEKQKQTN